MQTDTLNPFETSNGQFFTGGPTTLGATGGGLTSGTSSTDSTDGDSLYNLLHGVQAQEANKLELADLRRQVVYLQVFARCPDYCSTRLYIVLYSTYIT